MPARTVASTTTANAPEARDSHTAVWTGSEMIVWDGSATSGLILNTGGIYCVQSGPTSTPTPTPTATASPTPSPTSTPTPHCDTESNSNADAYDYTYANGHTHTYIYTYAQRFPRYSGKHLHAFARGDRR